MSLILLSLIIQGITKYVHLCSLVCVVNDCARYNTPLEQQDMCLLLYSLLRMVTQAMYTFGTVRHKQIVLLCYVGYILCTFETIRHQCLLFSVVYDYVQYIHLYNSETPVLFSAVYSETPVVFSAVYS